MRSFTIHNSLFTIHYSAGTHFKPSGKRDGLVRVHVRINPRLNKQVNGDFRGKWVNAENIGKSEAEIIALWNQEHPTDPIP